MKDIILRVNYSDKNLQSAIDKIEQKHGDRLLSVRDDDSHNLVGWIIAGIFAIHVLKPFSDSFLQEAGKDFYQFLAGVIQDLRGKSMIESKNTSAPVKFNYLNRSVSFHVSLDNDELIEEQIQKMGEVLISKEIPEFIKKLAIQDGGIIHFTFNESQRIWEPNSRNNEN